MLRPKAKTGRRCGWCRQEVAGTGHEVGGQVFCNPWHAEHFEKERKPFWQRVLKALGARDGSGGGSCC